MNSRKKTLVILTPGFAASEDDTTCLPSRQVFVKALKKNNPELNIVILAFEYPYRKDSYLWHGINIISFNGKNKRKLRKLLVWLSAWNALRKLRRQNNIIGLLNFWLGECALVGKYFGKLYNLRQYTWLLGQDAKKGNRFFSLVRPKGSELIALSDFIAEQVFINYKIKVAHIIPVGIDISMFQRSDQERDIDVLGAGSFIPLKRYDLFIYIIKELTFYFPKIHTMICGNGPEKEKLQALIDALSLNTNIALAGELPHQEVIRLMQHAKVFLHTSEYEGFGTVCAEALYAGCHVISFVKPMKEDIEHWSIAKTQGEMQQKLVQVLQDPGIEFKPVAVYTIDHIAEKMMALYR